VSRPLRRRRRALAPAIALAALAWAAALAATAAAATAAAEHQSYGRFGQVSIYRRATAAVAARAAPRGVVVLVSDDKGWGATGEELARGLEALDALVIGLDLPYYLRKVERLTQDCLYPAGDLEMLSKLVQKKLDLPVYTPPVLAGWGAGATLVYGALAQAPSGSFAGAISLGFCPRLDASHPLCAGRGLSSKPLPGGGYELQPIASLDQPWLLAPALAPTTPAGAGGRCGGSAAAAGGGGANGGNRANSSSGADPAESFVAKIHGAAVISPPKSSGRHPAAADLRAASGLKQAYLRALNATDLARPPETAVRRSVADLPLLELPAPGSIGDTLAVIVSGDGGWAGLDRDVASQLAERGFPVVGLNTLQYFWTPRNPDAAAGDLARLLRAYLAAWKRKDALLIGYSLGAEVLPFMVARLPPDLQAKVRLVALLGPGRGTSFEFRLSEWLGRGGGENRPVQPEVAKLKGRPVLCIYGSGEKATSLCTALSASVATSVALPGAHYLGGDPRAVVVAILSQLDKTAAPPAGPAGKPAPGGGPGLTTGTGAGAESAQQPVEGPAAGDKDQARAKKRRRHLSAAPPPATPSAALDGARPPADAAIAPGGAVPAAMAAPASGGDDPSCWADMARFAAWRSTAAGGPAAAAAAASAPPPAEETMQYGRFGTLHLLRRTPRPANVALFFSDEGGWDAASERMARALAERGFLAVGIDTRQYLQRVALRRDSCVYAAGSLENLSKVIQKRLGFPSYHHPVVAGYGTGAALAYGALAQAPAKTFRGGLGVAPCAELPGDQPLCPGNGLATRPGTKGGFQLLPAQNVEQPWAALAAAGDVRCPAAAAAELARSVPGEGQVTLAGLDHAFAHPAIWQPALRQAVDRLLAPPSPAGPAGPAGPAATTAPGATAPGATTPGATTPGATAPGANVPGATIPGATSPSAAAAAGETLGSPALPDLPVIEMPAVAPATTPGADASLAVIISGDGGWASVDREVAKVLAGRRGVPVVGLDALAYFWNGRTPDRAAADFERVLRHYLVTWKRDRLLLIGYSLGADVLPFLAARLPPALLDRTRVIALIGPSHSTPFEIRVREDKSSELPLLPELRKLRGRPLLCIAAEGEDDSLCADLGPHLAQRVELKGSHAYNGDYEQLADRILLGIVGPPASDARTMPGGEVYAFHVLFCAVFIPRWLLRWWHTLANRSSGAAASAGSEAAPEAGAETGAEKTPAARGGDARPTAARGSQLPLALHALALGVLYLGLARAVQAPPATADRPLLPPQPATGAVLMLAATALAAWALAVFRSWRLAARIDSGHQLCTAGPFRRVRHPIYLAMDLLAAGTWLWAPTAMIALGAALVALAGDLRGRAEERLLHEAFGESYDRYRRRAWRFVPGIY
jgi:type IV secretory pathway VirJ component/protein-S-isoprenylcysteine O-methyltransferase Ste14